KQTTIRPLALHLWKINFHVVIVVGIGSHVVIAGSHVVIVGSHVVIVGKNVVIVGNHVVITGNHVVIVGIHVLIVGSHVVTVVCFCCTVYTGTQPETVSECFSFWNKCKTLPDPGCLHISLFPPFRYLKLGGANMW
uniref:Uncharacterized protein n=1 Tax=Amphiprion percula TaxID=161767 RepID=A0A3P8SFT9_AMPPE